MDYITILIIISSVLMALNIIPYLINVINGKTKPRVVTWFVWALLEVIACFAAIVDQQYATAILLFWSLITTLSVAVLGWHYGGLTTIKKLDVFCFIGAMFGIGFWLIFKSPDIAMLITIAVDFIGGVPTLVHSWQKPREETWITYFLSGAAAVITFIAIEDFTITSIAYPIFLIIIDFCLTAIILIRRRYIK